ncbi:YdbC family protein [Carnobacterium jeotgali]
MNQKISFEILEELAVLSENTKGWSKELNLVRWNENPPKFDIREWSPDHEKMGKGITFTNEEMDVLKQFLNT